MAICQPELLSPANLAIPSCFHLCSGAYDVATVYTMSLDNKVQQRCVTVSNHASLFSSGTWTAFFPERHAGMQVSSFWNTLDTCSTVNGYSIQFNTDNRTRLLRLSLILGIQSIAPIAQISLLSTKSWYDRSLRKCVPYPIMPSRHNSFNAGT